MSINQLKRRWSDDPGFVQAYESLKPEFAVAKELIAARERAGLSQTEVARKMHTTQSAVARLEGGAKLPAMSSLQRYARAVRHRIELRLVEAGK
jgi:predicted transcriptional regulator